MSGLVEKYPFMRGSSANDLYRIWEGDCPGLALSATPHGGRNGLKCPCKGGKLPHRSRKRTRKRSRKLLHLSIPALPGSSFSRKSCAPSRCRPSSFEFASLARACRARGVFHTLENGAKARLQPPKCQQRRSRACPRVGLPRFSHGSLLYGLAPS